MSLTSFVSWAAPRHRAVDAQESVPQAGVSHVAATVRFAPQATRLLRKVRALTTWSLAHPRLERWPHGAQRKLKSERNHDAANLNRDAGPGRSGALAAEGRGGDGAAGSQMSEDAQGHG
eukprot:1290420-Rhodomonas_salina.1